MQQPAEWEEIFANDTSNSVNIQNIVIAKSGHNLDVVHQLMNG